MYAHARSIWQRHVSEMFGGNYCSLADIICTERERLYPLVVIFHKVDFHRIVEDVPTICELDSTFAGAKPFKGAKHSYGG